MTGEQRLERCAKKTTAQLFQDLERLHAAEGELLAEGLAHLLELDKRDAILEKAYPSLFAFCTRKLGYSEAEAFLRVRALRAARRFPRVLTMLERREIHLTAVAKLQPHLTPENYRSLLDRASRRSLEDLDRLIAELASIPEKRPVIRALTAAKPATLPEAQRQPLDLFGAPTAGDIRDSGNPSPRNPSQDERSRVLFNFVATETFRAKFKRAQELLWHKYPAGRPENIFDDALEALLERKDPERRILRRVKRQGREASRASFSLPA